MSIKLTNFIHVQNQSSKLCVSSKDLNIDNIEGRLTEFESINNSTLKVKVKKKAICCKITTSVNTTQGVAKRGEWPSGPASSISLTEVKHGCVRSETGWATFQMNDQKTAHSAVLWKRR